MYLSKLILQAVFYLPIQKSLKMEPSISSTSTFPTMFPRCLVTIHKFIAARSIFLFRSFLSNLSISFKHSLSLTRCIWLFIKILGLDVNFLLNFSLSFFIKISTFLLYFTETRIVSASNLWF